MRKYQSGKIKTTSCGLIHLMASFYYLYKILISYYSKNDNRYIYIYNNVAFYFQTLISGIYHVFRHEVKTEHILQKLDHIFTFFLGSLVLRSFIMTIPKSARNNNILIIHNMITISSIIIKIILPLFSKPDIIMTILQGIYSFSFIIYKCNNFREMQYFILSYFLCALHLVMIVLQKPKLSIKYFDYHDLGHSFIISAFLSFTKGIDTRLL